MTKAKPETNQPGALLLSRREVLVVLGSLSLMTVLASAVRASLRFLTPPVSQIHPPLIIAGPPADFPLGELTPLSNGPVFIGRDAGGLFALSAICTHLGCTITRNNRELVCPCHGSRFAANGTNQVSPASRPLPYLALTLNEDGLVEVNLAQTVEPSFRLKEKFL
jgi:Rieske Fe-S protein